MTLVDSGSRPVAGPFFEDLAVGDVFDEAPALTLTEGHAAVHQAVVGDRLRIALDGRLSHAVARAPIAHPALVCDVAIGQSTLATQRVVANLFYRGLVLRRAPAIGDTLSTRTEIVALRRSRSRPTGLAVLRVRTTDQVDRTVLDFWRCAMLPVGDPEAAAGADDDLEAIPAGLPRRRSSPRRWPAGTSARFGASSRGRTSTRSSRGCAGWSRAATSSALRRSSRGCR